MGINYKYRGISGRGRLLFLKFTYSGGTLQASNNRTTAAPPLQSTLLCMRYLTMITVTHNPLLHFWQFLYIYRLMWSWAIIIFLSCILRGFCCRIRFPSAPAYSGNCCKYFLALCNASIVPSDLFSNVRMNCITSLLVAGR